MTSDLDDVLSGNPSNEAEQPVEQTEQPEEPQEAEEAEATAETPEPEAEPAEKQEEPHMVPLSVLQEVRREMQALKQQVQPKPEAPKPPEFYDPEGAQFLQQRVSQETLNVRLDLSEEMTRSHHGDEVVDAAFEALKAANDPAAHANIMAQRNPYGALVKWHKQQQVAREVGDDPAAYAEKLRAQVRAEVEAEMVAKQAIERAGKPAPSMANVTGTGGGPKSNWGGPTPLDRVLGT